MKLRRAMVRGVFLPPTVAIAVLGIGLATSSRAAHAASPVLPSSAHLMRAPVLGAQAFAGRNGVGWGAYRPREIFNGGDPSGLVKDISWTTWGKAVAVGSGRTSIFRPNGGYFPGLVSAQLRATDLGHCAPGAPLAYRHLEVREPNRPGGKFGPWFAWSGAKTLCTAAFSVLSPAAR